MCIRDSPGPPRAPTPRPAAPPPGSFDRTYVPRSFETGYRYGPPTGTGTSSSSRGPAAVLTPNPAYVEPRATEAPRPSSARAWIGDAPTWSPSLPCLAPTALSAAPVAPSSSPAVPKPTAKPSVGPSNRWGRAGAAAAAAAQTLPGAYGATVGQPQSTGLTRYVSRSLVQYIGRPELSWAWAFYMLFYLLLALVFLHYVRWMIRAVMHFTRKLRRLGFVTTVQLCFLPATREQGTMFNDIAQASNIYLAKNSMVYHNDRQCRYIRNSRDVGVWQRCTCCERQHDE